MEGHYEVWKYTVPVPYGADHRQDMFSFDMPQGARVLTCQVQRGYICLWALGDVKAEKEKRDFMIVGTGHRILATMSFATNTPNLNHVGTVQLADGEPIFHIFEMIFP
jgi:hypothetical protein